MNPQSLGKKITVQVCGGTDCFLNGSFAIKKAIEKELRRLDLDGKVAVRTGGCLGACEQGPFITVLPEGILYHKFTVSDIPFLLKEHFLNKKIVDKFRYAPEKAEGAIPKLSDIEFFRHQVLIALRNRGRIDPDSIDDYIANDGFNALAKALLEMTPAEIIEEIKRAGLRGRGGAGFPTWRKWQMCSDYGDGEKYIICNADEGDPGAYMDRSIMESDPFSVLEGMLIGARAIGAAEGFIYVRDEYPVALEKIENAIQLATEKGLLGENILESGFDFYITIVRGGGAFVCGEETALIASLEGKAGRPIPRPPYPVESGLHGKPSNINNVETWANVAPIILRGSDWYASIGTEKSKGTKVFSLVGKVVNTGLVEVPMGISLRRIVFDIGGGIPKNKKFKAVQSGGPSGGCIPEFLLDLPVDYERLNEAGAIMGSGGLIVMDEDTCMVDVAKYFVSFLEEESCGKCTPCREGLKRMKEILTDIVEGNGKDGDIERLENLGMVMKDTALCGLGNTAANPVLTTIRYFRDEYESHIYDKRCPARVCKAMIMYRVIAEKCTGCQRCVKECPTNAITGPRAQPHNLDPSKCIKCGACYEICKFDAIAGDAIEIE